MTVSWGLLLGVAQVVWVVLIAGFIVLERRSPAATLAWITVVAALPLVGVAVYLLIGSRHLQRKRLRLGLARDRIGRLLREWREARAKVLSLQGQLMRAGAQLGHLPPEEAREARLFLNGDDCYDALVAAIGGARHHVHLEYYIFNDDQSGTRVIDALIERAGGHGGAAAGGRGRRGAGARRGARDARRRGGGALLQPRAPVPALVAAGELSYPPQDRRGRRLDRVHGRHERHR
jgi:hypothetical protein